MQGTKYQRFSSITIAVGISALAFSAASPLLPNGATAQLGSDRFRVTDHQDGIRSIAVSPDGKKLFVDGAIFDASTGRIVGGVPNGERPTFSSDGKFFVVTAYLPVSPGATAAQGVNLHDASSGRLIRTLRFKEGGGLLRVAFSDDSRLLAAIPDVKPSIYVWETASGKPVRRFTKDAGDVEALSFLNDHRTLVGIGASVVSLWDMTQPSRRRHYSFEFPSRANCIAVTRDGKRFAVGGDNGVVGLWESGTAELKWSSDPFGEGSMKHHDDGNIVAIAFSPRGNKFASLGGNGVIRVRDVPSGKEKFQIKTHFDGIHAVTFSNDGKVLMVGYDSGIRFWNAEMGKEIDQTPGHYAAITSVAFSPDGSQLVSAGGDIRVWNMATQELALSLGESSHGEIMALFLPGRHEIVSCGGGAIRFWDVDSGKEKEMLGAPSGFQRLAVSGDGKMLAAAAWNQALLFEVSTRKKLWELKLEPPPSGDSRVEKNEASDGALRERRAFFISHLSFSPDGRELTAVDSYGGRHVVSVANGKPEERLGPAPLPRSEVVASLPDRKTVVVLDADGTVTLGNPEGNVPAEIGSGLLSGLATVALSPDRKLLATGSDDTTILLWELKASGPQ